MVSRKRNLLLAGAAVAVLALVLASALGNGYLTSVKPGAATQNEGVGIQGAVTITLIGPNGQTLNSWKTHNSLVQPGITMLAECISNSGQSGDQLCPGGSGNFQSFTGAVGVAIGSCNSVGGDCGAVVASTNALWPHGCTAAPTCMGWVASASFGSTVLASALGTCTSDCPLNDVQSGMAAAGGGTALDYQFDNIPSANFPSPISISAGDALSININFTVA